MHVVAVSLPHPVFTCVPAREPRAAATCPRGPVTYRGPMTTKAEPGTAHRSRASGIMVRLVVAALAAMGLATTLPLTPAGAAGGLERFYDQELTWEACPGQLQCAWLTVPLDYRDPGGQTIALALSRRPADGPAAARLGSLVANPGGPGASGLSMPSYLAGELGAEVRGAYDIVGFDPRGVGDSAPITCLTGRQTTRWLEADSAPRTPSAERRYLALAEDLADGCLRFDSELARNIGSDWTVQDLEILREALGDERLNWFGFSYGTFLGALYAQAFPERVGRFVLDGAVDPSLNSMELSKGQNAGFQDAIGRFAADCSQRATCPFRGNKVHVIAGINDLLESIRATPLPAGSQSLTIGPALTAIVYSLYSTDTWPWLRSALGEARRGDGRGLADIADTSAHRIGPNRYLGNMASAFPAIGCWDSPAAPGRAGIRAAARQWARTSPVPELARSMAWGNAPCSRWFGHSPRGAEPVSSTTTSPMLIVGTTHDPATPLAWARALESQLSTSRLLTYLGDGHTAYGAGSVCVDSAVEAYLATGVLPAPGTRCR